MATNITGDNGDNSFIISDYNPGDFNIDGGAGTDTVNYFALGVPVTLTIGGVVIKGANGELGTDTLINIENIIGAVDADGEAPVFKSRIDGANSSDGRFNIDLSRQIVRVEVFSLGKTLEFGVEAFPDVFGTANDDRIIGDILDNRIAGNQGNDLIRGGDGNDILAGDNSNDGTIGNDTILGGAGNDILDGNGLITPEEVDILTGGTGVDQFVLNQNNQLYDSLTIITDFNVAQGDKINLPGSGGSAFENIFEFQFNNPGSLDLVFLSEGSVVAQFIQNVAGGVTASVAGADFLNFYASSALSFVV